MKKLIKLIILLVALLAATIGITYAIAPKDEKENIGNIFKNPTEFIKNLFSKNDGNIDTSKLTSDKLFDFESKKVVSINQTNFNSYFTDKTLSSLSEVTKLYQDAYRSLKIFETNAVDEKLSLFINLGNDLGKSMYIYADFTFVKEEIHDYDPDFVPVAKIKEIELKWYDGQMIGKYSKDGTTYDKTSQRIQGETFKVTNKSKASIRFSSGVSKWKDYDLEYVYHMDNKKVKDIVTTDDEGYYTDITVPKYTASEIQKVCDSLFTDLFQIDTTKAETTAPIGEVKLISLDGLKSICDCTYNYDKEVYGNHPLSDIWKAHKDEYKETMKVVDNGMLLFAVDFMNEMDLSKKTFYLNVCADSVFDDDGNVIGDANGIAEVYVYRGNKFYLIGIYSGRMKWVNGHEYDLTNYREWSLEQTFMYSDYNLDLNIENLIASTATFQNLMSINETDFPSEIMQNIFKTKE